MSMNVAANLESSQRNRNSEFLNGIIPLRIKRNALVAA